VKLSRRHLKRKIHRASQRNLRLQVSLFLVIIFSLLVFTVFMEQADARSCSDSSQPVEIVVKSGDTLWSIAHRIPGSENSDTRKIIHVIKVKNNLTSSILHPGQVLIVPASI
jgi:nucleoid-associated protein YgaU